MSAPPDFATAARDAITAALRGDAALGPLLNRVGDGEGEGAGYPHAQVAEVAIGDVGAKGLAGWEARALVSLIDRGPPARLAALTGMAQAALTAMPRTIGAWRTSGTLILRTRLSRRKDGLRLALIDVQLRGWLLH